MTNATRKSASSTSRWNLFRPAARSIAGHLLRAAQQLTERMTAMADSDKIVGHKTFSDGAGNLRHEPLTKGEAEILMTASDAAEKRRAEEMPDEQTALAKLMDAYQRLGQLGWADAIYCPKDGTPFLAIEAGSSGIHDCSYSGEWPDGHWYIHAEGDLWPSRPILFKLKP